MFQPNFFIISGHRNPYGQRKIKIRMMRYGKIDHANNPCTSQHSGCSLNPVKKDFWLPSGFWWPKDGRHQKFIKFLYLFKNNRPNEPLRKRRLTFAIRRTS